MQQLHQKALKLRYNSKPRRVVTTLFTHSKMSADLIPVKLGPKRERQESEIRPHNLSIPSIHTICLKYWFPVQQPKHVGSPRRPLAASACRLNHRLSFTAFFRYQFLLPNLFGASFALVVLVLVVFCLPETVDFGEDSVSRSRSSRCDKYPRVVRSVDLLPHAGVRCVFGTTC